ncbi:3,9-dihydroxypterocarpan 6A-monooxygenase-like [Lycium barbarum]|uniref:3,9-dihydroxypterocarpan 6A-monooxygenase-like n=1 Tax=Lycium barbarum TaxID=112863 RepID=UPI00293F700A|nr:3,9-dihydroxypterocarpan 6A-monooxygenase-like [Lycium barbarum]
MAIISLDGQLHILLFFIICLVFGLIVQSFIKKLHNKIQLPPSPPALPIIGHLHLLGSVWHQSFKKLALHYGPFMLIRAGASTSYVVSNGAIAKQVFKTNDMNFAARSEFGSSEYQIYHDTMFSILDYNKLWIFLKKICMMEILSAQQICKFADVRKEEMMKLLEFFVRCSEQGEACDVGIQLMAMTNNLICRLIMSTRTSTNVNESAEIREIAKGIGLLAGQLGLGEVFGPLKKYDLLGAGKKAKALLLKFDKFMDGIIKKHEDQRRAGRKDRKDMMDILLEIADDENAEIKLTRNCIKGLFLDLFLGGTDTTSVGLQWAVAELLNHPKALKKLQEEIERVVGLTRLVEDSDIPNLPYLQAVIKETLRVHPSLPLVFRKCREECVVNGYKIPKDSRVVLNVYAINRDASEWIEADEFIPERYLVNSNENLAIEPDELEAMKGQNFCYVPFGGGRRGCPGAGLAAAVLHRTLGVLVQCFDWKIKGAHKLNMEQGAGFSSAMVHPLVCYPVMRVNPQEIATPDY